MEEILASIRKIIAEEPIGSRPGPAPLPGLPDGTRSARSGSDSHEHGEPGLLPFPDRDSAGGETPYSVEDALADLIEDGPIGSEKGAKREPEPGFSLRPSQASEEDTQRPGWLFARPSPMSTPSSGAAGGSARPANPLDLLRPAPRADAASPSEAAGPGSPVPKPFSDLPSSRARLTEPSLPALDGPAARPDASEGSSKPVSSQDGPAEPGLSRQPPMNAGPKDASGSNGLAPRSEGIRKPAVDTPAQTAGSASTKTHSVADGVAHKLSPSIAGRDASPASPAVSNSSKAAAVASESASKPTVSEPARRPELSALDALAQGMAGAKSAAKPAVSTPAVAAPAAKAEPGEPAGARTLEDTVADLLRPMLRDWLDANMPRIVEKALRVELAANAQRSGKSEQN